MYNVVASAFLKIRFNPSNQCHPCSIILKTAVSPRKARKTRNKSECCVDLAIHPLGDNLQFGISLKIFVLFVFFVDEMIFLGLC